ncbi:hypothetical protein INT47_006265, partial [Mucor saturninus]
VFNDMIKEYGVKNTKAEELFSLDFEHLEEDGPVHGLIVITEFTEEPLEEGYDVVDPDEENIIFTSQVVTNACGTLAIVGVLLNADIEEKGQILHNFEEFTNGFSPINRGLCLGGSDEIRRIHNAYAPAHQIADNLLSASNQGVSSGKENQDVTDDYEIVYHYVTYIYKNGFLWKMDGLDNRPKKICKCDKGDWLEMARPHVEKRMCDSSNASIIAIKHDPYPKLVAENEILKSNIKKMDKVVNNATPVKKMTVKKHIQQFEKEADANVESYSTLKTIWTELEHSTDDITKKAIDELDRIREHQTQLESRVKFDKESRQESCENVCRQKFDYFPFLEAIVKKAYKRGLIEDDEKPKSHKKQKTAKNTTKSKAK